MSEMPIFLEIPDTIVAVSSPSGRSLQAIIKISGPEAVRCVSDIFVPESPDGLEGVSPYTSVSGNFHFHGENLIVPAVLYIMKQPYSYTKEDVVEIHTLGSPPLAEMLLDALLSQGIQSKKRIRLSRPGEFTKRAFLHGRIDLAQAEAVMHIIHAQTDCELETAVAQLTGSVSRQIKDIQDMVVSLCAEIEAAIDFSDQDIELISPAGIISRAEAIERNISRLLSQSDTGKVSREGVDVVLYGKPNAGKSSLINALLGKRRSVVSGIPGTTRDVVSGVLNVNGIRFNLTDTAGIEDTKGAVASQAIEKTRSALKTAHIVLLVFAADVDVYEQLKELDVDAVSGCIIIIASKWDLHKNDFPFELPGRLKKYSLVHTSALTGKGLDQLKGVLVDVVLGEQTDFPDSSRTFTVRQREALHRSFLSVRQALELMRNQESLECVAIDLRTAIDTLGEIVGDVTTETILDKIFSGFCVGK